MCLYGSHSLDLQPSLFQSQPTYISNWCQRHYWFFITLYHQRILLKHTIMEDGTHFLSVQEENAFGFKKLLLKIYCTCFVPRKSFNNKIFNVPLIVYKSKTSSKTSAEHNEHQFGTHTVRSKKRRVVCMHALPPLSNCLGWGNLWASFVCSRAS